MKGKCFACRGSREVKLYKHRGKKKCFSQENELCHFCCSPGHQLAECTSWKIWLKKKEAESDYQSKPQQEWDREASRCKDNCK